MNIKIKDPGSFLTHYIAMLLCMAAAVPLLYRVAEQPSPGKLAAFLIFAVSYVLLYAASSAYHFFAVGERLGNLLRKLDHMMIFVMIMGSYTPVCLVAMGDRSGWLLLGVVYGISLLGMCMNAIWISCPKWVSSAIYLALGWICIFSVGRIYRALRFPEFILLVSGGLIYTAGGVIYALKKPLLQRSFRYFGNHEVFHLFVMAGSACHYTMMLLLARPA